MKIYENEHAFVDAMPQENGSVAFTAKITPYRWIRDGGHFFPSQWRGYPDTRWWVWIPWRRLSYIAAAMKAIAYADAYARDREQAEYGLTQARRVVRGLRDQADALKMLEKELVL